MLFKLFNVAFDTLSKKFGSWQKYQFCIVLEFFFLSWSGLSEFRLNKMEKKQQSGVVLVPVDAPVVDLMYFQNELQPFPFVINNYAWYLLLLM